MPKEQLNVSTTHQCPPESLACFSTANSVKEQFFVRIQKRLPQKLTVDVKYPTIAHIERHAI